ncbi:MAG TPA: VOC family protein [Jatrophihabitans sp.]|jgi:catechol 2,3-dioxygenase-like lactoylglutathione lyase family enzyme
MVNLTGIHHVSINVTDLDTAVAFYTDVLGLALDSTRPDLAVEGVWLNLPVGQLHLIVGDVPAASGQHFAVGVNDLDEAVAELRGSGVEVRGPFPVGTARQAFLSDPDGNAIELQAGR